MDTNLNFLVVEDSLTQALRLKMLLGQFGGTSRIAKHGQEALEMVQEQRPSLVLTDILMPVMDGYELCRRLKSDPATKSIPVVLLTSLSDPEEVVKALQCGADNFLTKPYDPDFLIDSIRRIMENMALRAKSGQEGSRRFRYDGQTLELAVDTTNAIDLLLSTYSHAVQKNRLLEQLNLELTRSLETIRILQADYLNALINSSDAIIVYGMDGNVRFANPAAERLLGVGPGQFDGRPFPFPAAPGAPREVEVEHSSGGRLIAEVTLSETHWDGHPALLASMRDVMDTVRARESLQTMAYRDELTGLLNRRGFPAVKPPETPLTGPDPRHRPGGFCRHGWAEDYKRYPGSRRGRPGTEGSCRDSPVGVPSIRRGGSFGWRRIRRLCGRGHSRHSSSLGGSYPRPDNQAQRLSGRTYVLSASVGMVGVPGRRPPPGGRPRLRR